MRQAKIEVQTGAFFSMKDRPEPALDKGFSEVLQFAYCKILHIDRELLGDFQRLQLLQNPVISKERFCSEAPEAHETRTKQDRGLRAAARQAHTLHWC